MIKGSKERSDVLNDLRRSKAKDISFNSGRIFGSMCTAPHPIALEAHTLFHESNLGNPGLCPGTVDLERDVISMLGGMLCLEPPYGRVLSGGTEANITAMYMAKKSTGRRKVVFSKNAHFSVLKAIKLLDLEPVEIALDDRYRMDTVQLREVIDDDVMLVHAVAGSTELGTVDDIETVSRTAHGTRLHVDAAFGGFVLPFLDPEHLRTHDVGAWDFRVGGLGTMTVDPHKMGLSTIPSGCIMYRNRDALDALKVESHYLTSPMSFTLAGTRGSGAVAATWAVMRHLGSQGYRRIVKECMDNTRYLGIRLKESGLERVVDPVMNVVAFHHSKPIMVDSMMRKQGYFISTVKDPPALRFVVMPHVTKEAIDRLVPVLNRVLERI
ncbi:MAG: tyrosine decarboxylase MfnA [Candidatus Thermoplasmatota archaeon]|nr:tyrosine decarboxylase MfnA [Candidatus Thermoplasmatota archaeon]